ncbi:MAG: ABC transporter substrate-binding protein [Nocardiopsaceae bacterium]|nr:ABC transporter substrate-binding protein [Nocardiopsaceae bacterium]
MGKKKAIAVAAVALSGAFLATGCSSGSGRGSNGDTDWSKATSVAQSGGMKALIAAAQNEGELNVIGLRTSWANYGNIMRSFTAKYGIKINDMNPAASSQDEIRAMVRLKGQSRAPDVLDMVTGFAIKARQQHLLAKYQVAEWNDIPAAEKSTDGTWYGAYGGYVAIGYDSKKVKVPPTSLKDLAKPVYKHQVAIHGNPTEASTAFSAVYAAALANGGSLGNIKPGVKFFAKLKKNGNFLSVTAGPKTVRSGQTPIVVWWDYLLASEISANHPDFKIVIPTDASYPAYYDQAISADAPHPAAARLWEEYLYSVTGQNLWLKGKVRPVEQPTMVVNGTIDKQANAALPPEPSTPLEIPTPAQLSAANKVVGKQWPAKVGR